jgi:hypothetical protein
MNVAKFLLKALLFQIWPREKRIKAIFDYKFTNSEYNYEGLTIY